MKYSRGLDGLRGVAVLVVVLFHAQVPFADGGFLGVSVFFTLSGFLITSLLLNEFAANQTVSFRTFYVRRARRLLPAAYVCLLLVAMAGAWWTATQRADLPGDLIASVANVANWRFAFAPTNYADLFSDAPSPVAHFWSLAIEEQIYLVLPVVVVVALRRGRRMLGWVTATLLVVSIVATMVTSDRDLVYNGTHTRAAELLVGVALALFLSRPDRLLDAGRRRLAWVPGAVSGVVLLGLVAVASLDQAWIYRGGLPAVAVLSALLITAVVSERFPNRLLSVAPLVTLGRLSYGIYLFHWPIFVLLDAERTGLGPVALFAVRCVVVGAVTVVSSRLLERPVRLGRFPRTTGRFVVVTATGALAVSAAALVVVPQPGYTPTEQLLGRGDAGVVDFGAAEAITLRPRDSQDQARSLDVEPPDPFRVAVIGSEPAAVTALTSSVAVADGEHPIIEVIDDIRPECPLSTTAIVGCPTPAERFRDLQALGPLDAVVIAAGSAEDAELEPRSAAVESGSAMTDFATTQISASTELEVLIDDATVADVAVVLYSGGERFAGFDEQLAQLAFATPSIRSVIRTQAELTSALRVRAVAKRGTGGGGAGEQPLRVLVVGDSTSLTLAMALSDGSDGRLDVLWAGANGCPLAEVDAIRTSPESAWTSPECEPYDTKLPPLIASFAPEALLVVSGPIELAEHRFADDQTAHVATDPAFLARRDATIESLSELTDGTTPILVADMPAVEQGLFSSREMTSPDRLDALNDQIERWDRSSAQIARFAYRDTLESAEATPGALRSDGVHPDAGPLEELARTVYVGRLIELSARTRAELDAVNLLNG